MLVVPPLKSERILSGEWRTENRIGEANSFRVRCTSIGTGSRIYIESRETGELFAACPIPAGLRSTYVLPATDSSRNFLVRIEDATTGRHAFVGLSFSERGHAFDFNVALMDHERQVAAGASDRERASDSTKSESSVPLPDLSIPKGQSIRVELKTQKPRAAAVAGPGVGLVVPLPTAAATRRPSLQVPLPVSKAASQTSAALKRQ